MTSSFLSGVKASELGSHENIFHVTSNQTAREALELMVSKNIYAVPVYEHSKPIGLVNLRSIVTYIVNLFYKQANIAHDSANRVQSLGQHHFTTEEVKAVTTEFDKHSVKDLVTPIVIHSASTSVRDIVQELAKNERVAIGDKDTGKLTNIISQAVVVKYLLKHADKLGAISNEKIDSLNIITSPVQTVPNGTLAIISFAKMIEHNFSSLAIVDDDKQITGIISFKDIRGVTQDFRSFFTTTEEYVNGIRRLDFRDIVPTVNCRSTDTLAKVMGKLDAVGVHRLFVSTDKDKGHHFSGILTLADVLGVLVRH